MKENSETPKVQCSECDDGLAYYQSKDSGISAKVGELVVYLGGKGLWIVVKGVKTVPTHVTTTEDLLNFMNTNLHVLFFRILSHVVHPFTVPPSGLFNELGTLDFRRQLLPLVGTYCLCVMSIFMQRMS